MKSSWIYRIQQAYVNNKTSAIAGIWVEYIL